MKRAMIFVSALILTLILPLVILNHAPKEAFTELYFNDPENLPGIINIGEEHNFSFTAVSHEQEPKQHSYSIVSELLSENGSFLLNPGENMTITKIIKAKEIGEGNVTVILDGKEIHFFHYTFE